jgi:hypothetical protein
MNWITIKIVSQMTGKPERTIRHKAAQGQIRVKRDGSKWLCDINSLKELGWLPQTPEYQKSDHNRDSRQQANSKFDGEKIDPFLPIEKPPEKQPIKKKPHLLENLGVYKELLELVKKTRPSSIFDPPTADHLLKSLHYVGLGFYEFQTLSKIANFSLARSHLVHALICLQISEKPNDECRNQIENTLLPGIGGLIRRMEKRKNVPEQRFSSSTKN